MATSDERTNSTGEEEDDGHIQMDEESRREQKDGEVKLKISAAEPLISPFNRPKSESNEPVEFLDEVKKERSRIDDKKIHASRENCVSKLSERDDEGEEGHNRSKELLSKCTKESSFPLSVEIQAAKNSVLEGKGHSIIQIATADEESHVNQQRRAGMFLDILQRSSQPRVLNAQLQSSFSVKEGHVERAVKLAPTRQENASKQVQIHGRSHENHQRKYSGSLDLEQQISLPQTRGNQIQSTFGKGDGHDRSDGTLDESVRPRVRPNQADGIGAMDYSFQEEGANNSIKIITGRQENALVQGRISSGGHKSHRGRDFASLDLVQRSPFPQEREGQLQSAFNRREMGAKLFTGEKTAKVHAIRFQQVRIDRTDDGVRQKIPFTPMQSRSVSEWNRTFHSKVEDDIPILTIGENISTEETTSSWKSTALVTGRSDGRKWKRRGPVHDFAGLSMQDPFQGINTALFFLARQRGFADEVLVSIHLLASEQFTQGEIYALVNRIEAQLTAKHLPFCVEYNGLQGSARWFNHAFIEDQVKIKFQMLGQAQQNLRIINPDMVEQVITVHQIRRMSQPYLQSPGAEARLDVEFIGPVGKLCEGHIRITTEYGEITQNMLLPILSCRQNH
ncbi:uncharacterized protein LOC111337472 isoform X1 [Stylophora pistillata]|uniref:Uncharacterized protein n=1 Tax=Stylophora pistillata TaxID=50429 RepID=A0A2B4RT31_STYPI|nr:uncharacterized protein LOC111337472 isoform X1 [Stylophora pistillata]PFX19979.1 hypothetical protein AWC38_SpisGene15589 [Stylophora pistillata]